jgi:hypothetical protein
MVTNLHKNIVATVTYYDVLDFPLTPYEVWRFLISYDGASKTDKAMLRDVILALETPELQSKLAYLDGFVFLTGRGRLVHERIEREKLSVRKLTQMKKLAQTMRHLPFVRMIGATGSLSMKHGTRGSDWDMFIVFEQGKIWIGRFILTLFLHIIGKRRHGKNVQDRACLNYFITTDRLEIMSKDLYGAHEYQSMRLLWGKKVYERFTLANRWIQDFRPQYTVSHLAERFAIDESGQASLVQKFLEKLANAIPFQQKLINWQRHKIAHNPNTNLDGSHIEASDQALIFLPKPRGPKVFSEFKKRLVF